MLVFILSAAKAIEQDLKIRLRFSWKKDIVSIQQNTFYSSTLVPISRVFRVRANLLINVLKSREDKTHILVFTHKEIFIVNLRK